MCTLVLLAASIETTDEFIEGAYGSAILESIPSSWVLAFADKHSGPTLLGG